MLQSKSAGYLIGVLLGCLLALGGMIYGFLIMFGVFAVPSDHVLAGLFILAIAELYGFRITTGIKLDEITARLKKPNAGEKLYR